MKYTPWLIGTVFLSIGLVLGSLSNSETRSEIQDNDSWVPEYLQLSSLPNTYRLNPKVLSGGQPEGEAAFEELKRLKVKTIVSVDGIRPQVELAKKYGFQYVHLPLDYGCISDLRVTELAKVIRDQPGPIYFHCHHGLHRSPTAAAVASVGAGLMEPGNATAMLELVGTDKQYQGLYDSAAKAKRVDDSVLDTLPDSFPEVAIVEPLAKKMAQIQQTYDRLLVAQQFGWKTSQSSSEIQPAHEALLLREHFTELIRMEETTTRPDGFQELLSESKVAAEELESVLRSAKSREILATDAIDNLLNHLEASCIDCHTRYRE